MQVTKNITLDLLETGSPVIIKAKQNDRNTRYISAHLYVDGLAYPVPSGTEIAFRYKKPDGTAGFYDALPDNSPAITVSGNTVTVELVEQVLTAAGCVHCEINMYNAASEKLTTFTFEIAVEESVLNDAEIISSDYYNVLTAEIAKALQAVTDATEQAENAAQSAQDAADSAAMSKDWAAGQPVTYSGTPVSIAYAGAQRIASITAYGENAQGGTTEAPVALTGVDSVQVCGTNLFINNVTEGITNNGVTFTLNSDKSITVDGTNTSSTAPAAIYTGHNSNLPSGTYTLSSASSLTYGVDVKIKIKRASGNFIWIVINSSSNSQTFNIKTGDIIVDFYVVVIAGQTADNVKVYPMLNVGSTALPYEPYNGSITQLPIPRALHKVGDVRDVCRTRVKSKWDKSLQVESSELKKNNANAYQYYVNTDTRNVNKNVEPGCNRFVPSYSAGISAFEGGFNFWMKEVLEVDDLEHAKAWFDEHPTKVFYQSTAYDGTNGLDVCLTEYQNDFVELDGTEASHIFEGMFYLDYSAAWPTPANRVNGVCSHYPYGAYGKGKIGLTDNGAAVVYNPNGDYTGDEGGLANWKAYLAAQKEAGTPVQVAYQLAAPEVYATDPLTIDNAAGPLNVMTGGELEVRMTELIGNREFTERLSYIGNPNLLDNSNFTNPVNQRDGTSYSASTGNTVYAIDRWRIEGATYTVATHTLSGTSYTNRACRMAQFIEMEQYGLAIGDTLTFSLETNGTKHSATAKILDRDQYSNFESVPSAYSCADFDVVLCTGLSKPSILSFTICPKKALVLEWAKLEKGSVATPYVHKSYGAELSACQRYFYYLDATKWYACYQITGWGLIIPIDLPVPMRAQPTANTVGEVKVFTPSGWVNATSVSTNQFNRDKARINIVLTMPSGSMDSYEGRAMVATGIESLSADL